MSLETAALKTTIINLSRASGPDRTLDAEIASIMGWTSQPEPYEDAETGETLVRHLWFNQEQQLDKVPRYTWNLDLAMSLLDGFAPEAEGGFGWEPGQASAAFGGNKPTLASTPILAICMQALLIRLRQLEALTGNP
jgi:hypothetical protein